MNNTFFIGNEVRLKSGGPEMTLNELSIDGAHCLWFDGNILHSAWFNQKSLVYAR
jgi:uncharacterized protein YodC (DUF2158 family)